MGYAETWNLSTRSIGNSNLENDDGTDLRTDAGKHKPTQLSVEQVAVITYRNAEKLRSRGYAVRAHERSSLFLSQ